MALMCLLCEYIPLDLCSTMAGLPKRIKPGPKDSE